MTIAQFHKELRLVAQSVASSIVINKKLITISKCSYLCACFCSSRYWAKGIAPMACPSPNDREKLPVVTYPMIPSDGGGIWDSCNIRRIRIDIAIKSR